MLVAGIIAGISVVPGAHAALVGVVCLGDPSSAAVATATPCPSSPTFSGPIGNYLKVGVLIQGSDALNGFDIVLKTDHTKLQPLDATLDNTLLPGATTTIVKCIGGILVAGSVCPATDTIDTIEFAVTAGLGQITTPPTSGLLFNAIFNITGTGTSTIIFPSGCGNAQTPTSVPPSTCITISNGTPSPVSETAQTGSFDNTTPPPNLTLSASPTSIPSPGTSVVTVASHNGWPPTGATDSIVFTTIAPSHVTANTAPAQCTPSIPCTTTLSVSGTGNGPVQVLGTYETASSSGQTETLIAATTVTVLVPQNFALTVSPTTITSNPATATVTITTTGGFNTPVVLSLGSTLPATGLIACFSPGSVTGAGTSMVTFVGTPAAYNAQIKGTAGSMIKTSALLHVTVPSGAPNSCGSSADFALSANPTSVSGSVNTPATSTITVTPSTGFTGNVVLSVTPATCSVTPATVNGGSGTSILSCTATSPGSFTASVTGTSGSLVHTTTVDFSISIADFSLYANPATVPAVNVGVPATSAISIIAAGGFTGTVSLTVAPSTAANCNLSPGSIAGSQTSTLSCTGMLPGPYTATVTGTSGSLSHQASVAFTFIGPDFNLTAAPANIGPFNPGTTGMTSLSVKAVRGFTGLVKFTISTSPSVGISAALSHNNVTNSGSVTLKVNATGIAQSYTITVTATSGSLVHTIVIPVSVTDFTFIVAPGSLSLRPGTSGSVLVTLASQNGFNGTVVLSGTASPGLSVTFGNSSLALKSGGTNVTRMTVSVAASVLPGPYLVNFTATNRILVKDGQVFIQVPTPDYDLSGTPSLVTVNPAILGNSTITITSRNGFAAVVTLTVSPSASSLVCTLSRTTVSVAVDGSNTTVLSCKGSPGPYTVTVHATGTSSHGFQVSHSLDVQYTVSDFAVSANPTTITVAISKSSTSTITISTNNGFNAPLQLSVTHSSGINASIAPTSLSHPGTAVLTVSSTIAGSYSVTVTVTSGTVSHSVTITVTVSPSTPSNAANILGIDPTVFYASVAAVIAIGVAATFLVLRRIRTSPK